MYDWFDLPSEGASSPPLSSLSSRFVKEYRGNYTTEQELDSPGLYLELISGGE